MNELAQVIRRELAERRVVMIGALAIGVMILLVAFAPGDPPIPDIWNVLGMWWSILGLLGLAAYMGSSIIASELRENRLSFYLARPISIRTLWAGKMIAACVIPMIFAVLTLVPISLTGNGLLLLIRKPEIFNPVALFGLAGTAIVLVAAGHSAGISLRARSSWLLLDFVAVMISGFMFITAIRPLYASFALGLLSFVITLSAALITILLLVGGYLGLESGRTDLTRVHRMTSIVTAVALIATASAATLYSWKVRAIRPDQLETVTMLDCATVECSPIFTGSASWIGDFHPMFALVDEEIVRLPLGQKSGTDPNGKWAVWITPADIANDEYDIRFRSPGVAAAGSLGVAHPLWPLSNFALAGDRLAYIAEDNLSVIDLAEDQLVRSMKVEIESAGAASVGRNLLGIGNFELMFVDPDRLVVIDQRDDRDLGTHRLREIDIETGVVHERGYFDALTFWKNGSFLIAKAGTSRTIIDPHTGSTVASRDADEAVVTPDGFVFEIPGDPLQLEVTDHEGATVRRIALPGASDAVLGEITAGGRLPVAVRSEGRFLRDDWADCELSLVDLTSGEIETVARGRVPARVQNPRVRGPYYLEALPDGGSRLIHFEPGREITTVAGRP